MSTLRINNIEAQSIPASPTLDEKVKITNSSGDILVNIDGKTSGITTIGINTTDGNIKFDENSNVVVTGVVTATPVILFTITSALVPSARNKLISPPLAVILFIPEILFGLITVITLFIKPPQNYHQHSELR